MRTYMGAAFPSTDLAKLPTTRLLDNCRASLWCGSLFKRFAGEGLNGLAAAAAPSGFILEYGIMAEEPTPYPLYVALSKNLTIKAYSLFEVVSNPDEFPDEFLKAKQYVFDHLANGDFKPIIGRTFSLAEIVDAHRYMESNAQIGKIVVTV